MLVQAAQAGCTFSLKRQLVTSQAQATAAVLQHTSKEVELREQLQSATTRADAAELEMKKLGDRLVAQEELHAQGLRKVQVRLSSPCWLDYTCVNTLCQYSHDFLLEMSTAITLELTVPQHAATEGWHY